MGNLWVIGSESGMAVLLAGVAESPSQKTRVLLVGSWDLLATYNWAYSPIYNLPNWPYMDYPNWVTSPVMSSS